MLSGSNISFWTPFTQVRLPNTEKWSELDKYDFESYLGTKQLFQFNTTAVYEAEAEEGLEPWQEPDQPDVTERPCTWTIRMQHCAWVRTIYLTPEEERARVPN